ncbi:hypothetical protein FZEAL_8829 [Fusarium zealandicum]|uniref:FAD-binding PCMH-type domain-containing protein n=1 Tax=Fusarium zealandicum TaxID=1053134 RepID=A0A8H4UDT0_9HYPO|nr:hypothetical protein FZEAL_8829 [Fusarium zealandicum]
MGISVAESILAPASEAVVRTSSSGKAPFFLAESIQLTDNVLANLPALELFHIGLFQFDDEMIVTTLRPTGSTTPTSELTIPLGSMPFGSKVKLVLPHPFDASDAAHIQLAINLVRSLNLRLVIKNTGHDFGAKPMGYNALSVWTHNLKSIEYFDDYEEGDYKDPAVKAGAGVQAYEAYGAAYKNGVTLIGGEGQTVGVVGGYIQGGGHSPLSGLFYGVALDSVLSFQVVTASGRIFSASETCNSDLFWAIRGGGGGTFDVVTSAVVKAHPKVESITTMTFAFNSGADNVTDTMF